MLSLESRRKAELLQRREMVSAGGIAWAHLLCCCCLASGASAKKNLQPTAHVAVDMGSQFLKVAAEQSVRGATRVSPPLTPSVVCWHNSSRPAVLPDSGSHGRSLLLGSGLVLC